MPATIVRGNHNEAVMAVIEPYVRKQINNVRDQIISDFCFDLHQRIRQAVEDQLKIASMNMTKEYGDLIVRVIFEKAELPKETQR